MSLYFGQTGRGVGFCFMFGQGQKGNVWKLRSPVSKTWTLVTGYLVNSAVSIWASINADAQDKYVLPCNPRGQEQGRIGNLCSTSGKGGSPPIGENFAGGTTYTSLCRGTLHICFIWRLHLIWKLHTCGLHTFQERAAKPFQVAPRSSFWSCDVLGQVCIGVLVGPSHPIPQNNSNLLVEQYWKCALSTCLWELQQQAREMCNCSPTASDLGKGSS